MWSEDVTSDESKLYRIASFCNSDGEPFGLTIRGNGKQDYEFHQQTSKIQTNFHFTLYIRK